MIFVYCARALAAPPISPAAAVSKYKMASSFSTRPPLPLPPGVMPSESRQNIVDLLGKEPRGGDGAERILREVTKRRSN